MCSFYVKSLEFFVYFGDQSSVRCGISEDLFQFCRLLFCPVDYVPPLQKFFSFRRSHLLIVTLSICATEVISRKCYYANAFKFTPHFLFYWNSVWLVLSWDLCFIWNWVLCMAIYIYLFSSSTCCYPVIQHHLLNMLYFCILYF